MSNISRLAIAIAILPLTFACGGTRVMVPPAIDLRQHEVLAIIEFGSSNKGELGPLATQKFMQAVRRDQGLVRIIALGPEEDVLREVGSQRLDAATYKELGRRHEVTTIFVGELVVSDIRPAIQITSDLATMGVAADVDATLTAQMVETATGASIWSRSASVTRRVGQVSVLGAQNVVFDADNPERAYGELVSALAQQVTPEFRARWERR